MTLQMAGSPNRNGRPRRDITVGAERIQKKSPSPKKIFGNGPPKIVLNRVSTQFLLIKSLTAFSRPSRVNSYMGKIS